MSEDSIGWSMKECMRCVSNQLENQGMEIPEDEDFKSVLKELIMIQAAQIAPKQEETLPSFQMSSFTETDPETAPQYEDNQDNDDDDDAEDVLDRKKMKKSRKKGKGTKSVKRAREVKLPKRATQERVRTSPRNTPEASMEDHSTDDAGGNSPTRTDSDASDSDHMDSGDEELDVRNIISTKGRSLRKDPTQPKAKSEMTYSEAVAEAQQKIVNEELQAVQSAERALTEAELHRKALIEMDEEEREEMTERLRAMAIKGIRRQVLPMLRRAQRQVDRCCP